MKKDKAPNKSNLRLFTIYFVVFYILIFILLAILPSDGIIYLIIKVLLICLLMISPIFYFVKKNIMLDNIKKDKLKSGKTKFKFTPLKINVNDVKFWLENAIIPDAIYIKGENNKYFVIEVWFEVEARTFYNKTLWFDGEEAKNAEDVIRLINENHFVDENCRVLVSATTEYNDPIYFSKVLDELKKKFK